MELRQLEHFVAVAEEQHFTRAAQRQAIAQSALSASVRALERELGAVLFLRSTRRVELTEAGRVLLVEARRALAAVQGARDAVAAVQGLERGQLRIGYTPLLERLALQLNLGLLARFHREHPGVELRLHQAPTDALLDELREGRLDIAFVSLLGQPARGLAVTVLARDVVVMACPPEHPLANRDHVTFLELAQEPFIDFMPQGALKQHLDRAFAAVRHERHTTLEVDAIASALRLVANGFGITVLPRLLIGESAEVCAVPLRPELVVEIAAVAAEEPPASAAAQALLALILPHSEVGPSAGAP